jgi:hypothetical protein
MNKIFQRSVLGPKTSCVLVVQLEIFPLKVVTDCKEAKRPIFLTTFNGNFSPMQMATTGKTRKKTFQEFAPSFSFRPQ